MNNEVTFVTGLWDLGRDNSYTGDFYFHLNGSAKLRIGTSSVTSYGDFTAPIFYDTNTSYYGDFAGTSQLNIANINDMQGSINGMPKYVAGSVSGMGVATDWDSRPAVGNAGYSINYHTGVSISGYPSYGGVRLYSASYPTLAGSVLRLEASSGVYTYGAFTNDSSVTAPIFYDTNTAYYFDGSSTSNIHSVQAIYYYGTSTSHYITPSALGASIRVAGDIYLGESYSSSNIFMGDSDEGQRQIHCNSNRIGFMTQAGAWGSYCNDDGSWTSDGDISTGTVFRGQVFYDTNNSAYACDPTGVSVLQRTVLRRYGNIGGNDTQLEISNQGTGSACVIAFHREGAFGANFSLATDNVFTTAGWSSAFTGLDTGQLRVLKNDGTNAVQFLTSRPGVADSFYVHASDAWAPNGEAATLKIGHMSWTGRSINAGGSINQYGGDYAEYMTKNGDFTIAKGDVCGIDVNGKLTKTFSEAISFVVKSTNPGLVGGDTWGAEEEVGIVLPTEPIRLPDEEDESLNARKAQYAIDKPIYEAALQVARAKVDRIAFCGQVPVNVTGAVSGQYIVPVNDNGAIKGIAINEDDLTMSQYIKAVGKVIKVVNGIPTIIVKII